MKLQSKSIVKCCLASSSLMELLPEWRNHFLLTAHSCCTCVCISIEWTPQWSALTWCSILNLRGAAGLCKRKKKNLNAGACMRRSVELCDRSRVDNSRNKSLGQRSCLWHYQLTGMKDSPGCTILISH